MNRISIVVDDIDLVLQQYTQIKVYRATSQTGAYSEITDPSTRIAIIPENTIYYYIDNAGTTAHWYKTSYYNPAGPVESDLSSPRRGGTEAEKIGYSFRNYTPPAGEWGKVITADDMRYFYLFGIDAVASDLNESTMPDEQLDYIVELALAEFERYLGIDIRKRVYKTRPDASLVRGRVWRSGVDYTHEEEPYDFMPEEWQNFGFVQLRHYPIISMERAKLYSQVSTEIIDLLGKNWVRLQKDVGQVQMFPQGGYAYGPYAVGMMPWRILGSKYPNGYQFDYTTGYPTSDYIPDDLRNCIGKLAAVQMLATIGDGILVGFGSGSVSLDGLSESFSSTLGGGKGYFAARIEQFTKEITDWLAMNRRKYGPIPMSFVGV